jgi:hypothetical protein
MMHCQRGHDEIERSGRQRVGEIARQRDRDSVGRHAFDRDHQHVGVLVQEGDHRVGKSSEDGQGGLARAGAEVEGPLHLDAGGRVGYRRLELVVDGDSSAHLSEVGGGHIVELALGAWRDGRVGLAWSFQAVAGVLSCCHRDAIVQSTSVCDDS